MNKKQIVAAFDFDGTLTKKDAFLPFVSFLKTPLVAYLLLASRLPWFAGFALGIVPRQKAKEAALGAVLKEMDRNALQQVGQAFAEGPLNELLKPEAVERLRWHQQQGHRCILISATLDIFLEPWAEQMRFDDLICSQLAFDSKGFATGKLCGLNCWGPEKVRRLLNLLGPKENFELYAYGDSRGDRDLLELADHPFYKPDFRSLQDAL